MAADRKDEVLAVCLASFILTWLFMTLRVWVRASMLRSFGRDDWAMVATQILFTAYLSCQLGGVVYGTGRHLEDLEPERARRALSFWFFCELFYIPATAMMKVAIGFFILRVAINPVHVWIVRIIMVSTAIFGSAFTFVVLFQCWPVSTFWSLTPHDDDGKCIDVAILLGLTYGISGLNVIADWTFAILPAFIVKDLQISRRQKGMVAAILALAALGSTATVVRLPYIHTISESYLGDQGDFLWDTVPVAVWTTVEVGVGITAGCIATLRPLLQAVLSKFNMHSTSMGGSRHLNLGRGPKVRYLDSPSLPLDGLSKGHGVTTTITGNRETGIPNSLWSRGSSQERLALPENITKHVTVSYDETESAGTSSDSRLESGDGPPAR